MNETAHTRLKLTRDYLNSYEKAYDFYKHNRFFTEEDWDKAMKDDSIDMYIDMLSKSSQIDRRILNEKYNFEFANQQTRMNALYNELYADRTVKEREVDKYDNTGKVVGTEKLNISDYDYYANVIKYQNDTNMQEYFAAQARAEKEAMSGWGKFGAWIASTPGSLVKGVTTGFDDIVELFGALTEGSVNAIKYGKGWAESVGEVLASDKYRVLQPLTDTITDFEMQYGWRDPVTGEYNSKINSIVGGSLETIGQMLPSAIPFAGVAGKAASIGGRAVFYASTEFGQSYERSYEYAKENNLDMNYGKLMLADATATIAKVGVELALEKVFGPTGVTNLLYGTKAASMTTGKATSLFVKGLFDSIGDALQEGTEEVLQDVVDALVHDMYGADFAGLSTLSGEDLALTFITAAFTSVLSTAGELAFRTPRQTIVKDGKIKKLTKLSSKMLSLEFANVAENVTNIMNLAKDGKITKNGNISKQYSKAFQNTYNSAKILGTLFDKVGEERTNTVLSALTRINDAVKAGYFDEDFVIKNAQSIATNIFGDKHTLDIHSAAISGIVEDIKNAGLDRIATKIDNGENVENNEILSKDEKSKIDELLSKDKNINKLVITEKGKDIVTHTDKNNKTTTIIPKEILNKSSVNDLSKFIAGKKLINTIKSNDKFVRSLPNIVKLYKEYANIPNVTRSIAISALLSDSAFFEVALFQANSDAYEFLSQLGYMADVSAKESLEDKLYLKVIADAKANMRKALIEYLTYQTNADINLVPKNVLTDSDIALIKRNRYADDIATRIKNGNATDTDIKFITKKINALPVQEHIKRKLLSNIVSNNFHERYSAWSNLLMHYRTVFNNQYDGLTYMPKTSVPNFTFNTWLHNMNLTIPTLTDITLNKADTQLCMTKYGAVNYDTVLKLRQYQFNKYTKDKYSFRFDDAGKVVILDNTTNAEVGFNIFTRLVADNTIDTAKFAISTRFDKSMILRYCNDKLSDLEKASLSLNDIITDKSLLSKSTLDSIAVFQHVDIDDIGVQDVFEFFKNTLLDLTKGTTTVTVLNDGTYGFADVAAVTKLAGETKKLDVAIDTLKKTGGIYAKDFINKNYIRLAPQLENVFFVLSNDTDNKLPKGVGGLAVTNSNKIIVNKDYTTDRLKFVMLHEFMHKVQEYNAQNLGFNHTHFVDLYTRKKMSKEQAMKLIKDFKVHVPKLFVNAQYTTNANNKNNLPKELQRKLQLLDEDNAIITDLRIIGDFIYYTCGEVNAYGMEASTLLTYYPTVVAADRIIMPWGTTYSYDTASVMNFVINKDKDGKYFRTDIGTYLGKDMSNVTKYNNFLEMFKDKDYADALELYNYLRSKTPNSGLYINMNFRDMYINEYSDWAKLYDDAFDKFTSMKSALAIAAYKSIQMNNTVSLDNDKIIKDNLVAAITAEDRRTSLELLKVQIAPNMSFEDFLNLDLPYVRVQQNDKLYNTDFVSVSVGSFGTASFAKVLYDDLFSKGYNYAYVGTIKPSQIMMYIDPVTFEAIVSPEDMVGADSYLVDIREDGVYVHNDFTEKVEYIHSKEMPNTDTDAHASYFVENNAHEFGGPRPPKFADENEYEEIDEKDVSVPKNQNANYEYRRVFRNKAGKLFYKYYGQKTVKKRQVSKKSAGDTNLKYFANQRISPELQTFVRYSNDDNATKYIDKIQKGSLTTKEVLSDFRHGKITDTKTFALFNKAFFNNEHIKTPQQLENLLDDADTIWAARKFLLSQGFSIDDINEMSLETFYSLLKIIAQNADASRVLATLRDRYSVTNNNRDIDIDETYLRISMMKYYDGTLEGAIRAINLPRTMAIFGYVSSATNNIKASTSLDAIVGDDLRIGDRIKDESADLFTVMESERERNIQLILTSKIEEVVRKYGKDKFPMKEYQAWASKIRKLSDEALFLRAQKILTSDAISRLEKFEADVQTQRTDEEEKLIALMAKMKADTANIVRSISHKVSTIRNNLKPKDIQRFLKDNGDIFTDKLRLKDEVLHDKDNAGRLIYKSREVIDAVNARITELSKDVRAQKYSSKKAYEYSTKLEKEITKLRKKLLNTVQNGSKPGNYKSITIVEQDRSMTVDTSIPVPEKLVPLLNYALSKQSDTNIAYLSSENEKHVEVSMKNFIKDNADYLTSLTQNDIDDIVNFYLTAEVIPSTNDAAKYTAIQIMLLTYITKGARDGLYIFDAGVLNNIENRLKSIVSTSSIVMNSWQTALRMLKPVEQLVSHFYAQYGVNLEPEQLNRIGNAYRTGDAKVLAAVRARVYEDMKNKNSKEYIKEIKKRLRNEEKSLVQVGLDIKKTGKTSANTPIYTTKRLLKKSDTFFRKAWNLERAFMLSAPGTAMRNLITNFMIGGGIYVKDRQILPGLNDVSGKIGKLIADKTLPKKWKKENQWQIIGTKVTPIVQQYIKQHFLDSGLMTLIGDAMSKYDYQKVYKTASTSDVFAELIVRKLAQDVYNDNHKVAAFFSKLLSDDRAINKTAIKYFGKLLTEDNTTLVDDEGKLLPTITQRATELFVEAYAMAAYDFMHKTNFMHKIEEVIKTRGGDTAYFVWKQFFPFAASSVNWYVEALRYTPFGLIKSIINFAKLETQIEKMDKARDVNSESYERTPSSKFAQYIAVRNIGKGVVGSIGTLVGVILALTGIVKLDEDDDKYKLRVGNVSVDISEIFSTQGILLGMQITQGIRDSKENDEAFFKAFWKIIRETTNLMFDDSIYTSVLNIFKYGGDDTATSLSNYLTYTIPSMFVPNFLKTLASIAQKYDVKYSKGVIGKLEKLVTNSLAFTDRMFPSSYDPYTGDAVAKYTFGDYFVEALNKLGVMKFKTYDMSDTEELAMMLDAHRGELTGRYTINDEQVNLKAKEISAINQLYGKLNKKDLAEFTSDSKLYKVETEKGDYITLRFSQMTDKQIASVFNRIMDNNAKIAKVYALTKSGKYKYYATDAEYVALKKLGITTNVYKKTNKLEGFVKIK